MEEMFSLNKTVLFFFLQMITHKQNEFIYNITAYHKNESLHARWFPSKIADFCIKSVSFVLRLYRRYHPLVSIFVLFLASMSLIK